MSTHRISPASRLLSSIIKEATQNLTVDQIREALSHNDRHLVENECQIKMTHLIDGAVTSGNRTAIHAGLAIFPKGAPTEEYRVIPALVTWTFHRADNLVERPDDLILELDRIEPVRD